MSSAVYWYTDLMDKKHEMYYLSTRLRESHVSRPRTWIKWLRKKLCEKIVIVFGRHIVSLQCFIDHWGDLIGLLCFTWLFLVALLRIEFRGTKLEQQTWESIETNQVRFHDDLDQDSVCHNGKKLCMCWLRKIYLARETESNY